ncbi:MAG: transposase [Syntrophomonadaceae bacterium]|nr:transposase [Syntrophomonadaceae bacterium]
MPRWPRRKSESGLYHVISRGLNRENIFFDDDDRRCFLRTLQRVKPADCRVHGYCLMDNHVHLLLAEGSEGLPRLMQRLASSYAWYVNSKYERVGHVFQGRYRSECIEDDDYLLTALAYIHLNPVRAGLVTNPEDYPWSSLHIYLAAAPQRTEDWRWRRIEALIAQYCGSAGAPPDASTASHPAPSPANVTVDAERVLRILAPDPLQAMIRFRQHLQESAAAARAVPRRGRMSDRQLASEIEAMLGGKPIACLQDLAGPERAALIRRIKHLDGVTLRQVSRVTGLSLSSVYRA